MSIGRVQTLLNLVYAENPNQAIQVKVGKGVFNGSYTNPSWTITEYGDNLEDKITFSNNYSARFYIGGNVNAILTINCADTRATDNQSNLSVEYTGSLNPDSGFSNKTIVCLTNSKKCIGYKYLPYFGLQIVVDDSGKKPVYGFVGFPCVGAENDNSQRVFKTYTGSDKLPLTIKLGLGGIVAEYTTPEKGRIYTNLFSAQSVSPSIFSNASNPIYPDTIYGFPYGDGESTSQGGQGEMDDTTEPIEIDSKPLLTTGEFLRVYKMTATNLTALRDKLISDGFLDNLIAKLRTDAMDYIVGLNAIPYASTSVADSTIKIANLDTEIAASYLTWYIEDFDFGEIELKEYFQTFMDYSPYTKLSVFVPFCGIVPLNVDQFMNDKIKMKCRIDLLTGQFVVFISNSVGIVTTVSGNCAYQLPIRANDYNRLVTSGLGLLGGIVGTAGALATGNVPLAIGAGIGTAGGLVATSQAMTKPDVTSKGSLGGNYGLLGNRTPYLIIQRPTISVPKDYGKTLGYMSRITAKLGDLTGYTVLEEIHLEHISATDDEKKLIENALKSGVIL